MFQILFISLHLLPDTRLRFGKNSYVEGHAGLLLAVSETFENLAGICPSFAFGIGFQRFSKTDIHFPFKRVEPFLQRP